MNNAYDIKLDYDGLLPKTRATVDYQLHYSYNTVSLEVQAEELAETEHGIVKVGISDVLCHIWQITADDLKKVLYEYARQHVVKLAEEGRLGGTSTLELKSGTAPTKCPFDPSRITLAFDTVFRVVRRNRA